jgi:hypothetical protein
MGIYCLEGADEGEGEGEDEVEDVGQVESSEGPHQHARIHALFLMNETLPSNLATIQVFV